MTRVSGSPLAYLLEVARHPRAVTLRARSRALGDNLLLTCPAREIKKAYPGRRVLVETRWPDLFVHNPYVDAVFTRKVSPSYHKVRYLIDAEEREHMIDQIVKRLPLPIESWERTVDLFLPEETPSGLRGSLPGEFIAVNPAGKQKHSANRKEWGFENFAALRRELGGIAFVQVGDRETPLLPRTADFRGRSILESAAVIRRSRAGVFLEGGLMHVACGVRRPSVIVYGGAVRPEVSGYAMHRNIATSPECSPCFTSDAPLATCDTMICMKRITVERVAEAVRGLLGRS